MGTQAVVSLVGDNNATLIKAVCGCNGGKAKELAGLIKTNRLTTPHLVYSYANAIGFGCRECLVVLSEHDTVNATGDDLGALWEKTFADARFNPRWENGTASHVELVKFDFSFFEQPMAFGYECDYLAVRGDLDATTAAKRLIEFSREIDQNRFFCPGELKRCNAHLGWDEAETDYLWRLDMNGVPPGSKQSLEVWYVDEEAGR